MNWPATTHELVVSALRSRHERISDAVLRVLVAAAMLDVHPREGVERLALVAGQVAADFEAGWPRG
jgi:hypothetical protein